MFRKLTVVTVSFVLNLLAISADLYFPATLVWPVLIGLAQIGIMWWAGWWGGGLIAAYVIALGLGFHSMKSGMWLCLALLVQGGLPAYAFRRYRLDYDLYRESALSWFLVLGVLINSLGSALLTLPVCRYTKHVSSPTVMIAMLWLAHSVVAMVMVLPVLRFGTHWLPSRGAFCSQAAFQRSIARPSVKLADVGLLLALLAVISGLSISIKALTILPSQVINVLFLIPIVVLMAQRGFDGALLAASLSFMAAIGISGWIYGIDIIDPTNSNTTLMMTSVFEMGVYYLISLVVGLLIDAQRGERRRLATLLSLERIIATSAHEPSLLTNVTTAIQQASHAALCVLWRYQSEQEQLVLLHATPEVELPRFLKMPIMLGRQPLLREVMTATAARALHSDETTQTGLQVLWLDTGFISSVVVPLWGTERVFGMLAVFDDRPERRFTAEEVRLIEAMCGQAAGAIEQQRLIAILREQTEQFNVVAQITATLNASLDLDTVCHRIALHIARVVPYSWAAVALEDPLADGLTVVMSTGAVLPYHNAEQLMLSYSLRQRLRVATLPIYIEIHELADPWVKHLKAYGLRCALLVPLRREDQWLGVLALASTDPQTCSGSQHQLLVMLARHMALAIANARLYAELDHAYRAKDEAQSVLIQSERLRALGELASGIAHDFNNLLAGILGHTQLLLLDAEPSNTPTLHVIEQAARDGKEMIQRIQQFATARSGNTHDLDINQIIHDVLALTSPRLRQQGTDPIIPQLDLGELPAFHGIAHEIRQVLTNLVLNAIDAMPSGGTLTIHTSATSHAITISIEDTGVGISPEIQSAMWKPFFSTKGEKGTGMGLTMTHTLIVQHYGGTIEVDSTEGQGTLIRLLLPLATPLLEPIPAPSTDHAPRQQYANILIAEHDPRVASALYGLLESWGHQVVSVDTAMAALQALEREDYTILIADSNLTDLSVWTLATKAKSRHRLIQVLLLSVWGDWMDTEPRRIVFDAILAKPFESDELQQTIRDLLAQRWAVQS